MVQYGLQRYLVSEQQTYPPTTADYGVWNDSPNADLFKNYIRQVILADSNHEIPEVTDSLTLDVIAGIMSTFYYQGMILLFALLRIGLFIAMIH